MAWFQWFSASSFWELFLADKVLLRRPGIPARSGFNEFLFFVNLGERVMTSCSAISLSRLAKSWKVYILAGSWCQGAKIRDDDADGNENVKKTIGLISKTTTLHVRHAFLYISLLFLHDYDVKMPNFAFYGGRKQATTKLYFSFWAWLWSLEIQLQEGSPTFDKVSG